MNNLIALTFENSEDAEIALPTLKSLHEAGLIDLENAIIVTRDTSGEVKIEAHKNNITARATSGAWWGALIGLILAGPLGLAVTGLVGVGIGALAGSLEDYGIEDVFMREVGKSLPEGASALFLMIENAKLDKALNELNQLNGRVLRTSLNKANEEKLKAAVEGTLIKVSDDT